MVNNFQEQNSQSLVNQRRFSTFQRDKSYDTQQMTSSQGFNTTVNNNLPRRSFNEYFNPLSLSTPMIKNEKEHTNDRNQNPFENKFAVTPNAPNKNVILTFQKNKSQSNVLKKFPPLDPKKQILKVSMQQSNV